MKLKEIKNNPLYQHTIAIDETTFLASVEGKDFYYRYNGINHMIDVRHSEQPSDYVSWLIDTVSTLYIKDYKHYTKVIPKFIYDKALYSRIRLFEKSN